MGRGTCAVVVWTPLTGWQIRSGRMFTLASIVREMEMAAKRKGFIVLMEDEVIR